MFFIEKCSRGKKRVGIIQINTINRNEVIQASLLLFSMTQMIFFANLRCSKAPFISGFRGHSKNIWKGVGANPNIASKKLCIRGHSQFTWKGVGANRTGP